MEVSHLLFVDGTLIFCDVNHDQLRYLSQVFIWFEVISDPKINLDKSEVIPIWKVSNAQELAQVLGCRIGKLPTSYLGLSLGASYKSSKVWDTLQERFRKRLALWKRQYLFKGGRLTLIKALYQVFCLTSCPYSSSKVGSRLEKNQRDFYGEVVHQRKDLIQLIGTQFAWERRMRASKFTTFLSQTRHCLASGIGDLIQKGNPHGNKS